MFDYVSQGQIEVTIKFSIRSNTLSILDDLNRVLHTREPKKLYFEDRPDRYLMAVYVGDASMNRRYYGTTSTLTFISPHSYWYSTEGEKSVFSDELGTIEINNEGTAPVVPRFTVDFPAEAGFLGIVAPNGFIALGDKEEKDEIELPMQRLAMNEEMHESDMSDWTRLTSDRHSSGLWVPDYNKLSLTTGRPSFDQWGVGPNKATSPKTGYYWNSWGYTRNFNAVSDEIHRLTNFKLMSRIVFEDQSGRTSNTGMFLIVLMDKDNKPIMTTSIYNVLNNSNEVTITAKVNDFSGSGNYRSKIIKTAKFPNGFNGNIQMSKEGNEFKWIWDSAKNQTVTSSGPVVEKFSIGSTVYIKTSARTGYHSNGGAHSILGFTRGRANRVQAIRTFRGKRQYLIAYRGIAIYWMNEEDVTANRSGVGKTRVQSASGERRVVYSTRNTQLATLTASKVLVIGGVWDKTSPFSRASVNSMVVHRLNEGDKFVDIANTFSKGDKLTIDNSTGEVLHNGSTFQGLVDVDSRFFDVDYGPNELQVVTSEWSSMPRVKCSFTERYR